MKAIDLRRLFSGFNVGPDMQSSSRPEDFPEQLPTFRFLARALFRD